VKFYYTDERQSNGDAVYSAISGEAAATEYLHIARRKTQGPWLYTFVKDRGYVDFEAGKMFVGSTSIADGDEEKGGADRSEKEDARERFHVRQEVA
jgi:hypothetical protein